MVRVLLLGVLACGVGRAEISLSQRFVTEFSKNPVYQGETVTAHFVLYAMEDRVEVEVAKFPEFRGFWSENTALRQGPMMLLPTPDAPRLRKRSSARTSSFPCSGPLPPK